MNLFVQRTKIVFILVSVDVFFWTHAFIHDDDIDEFLPQPTHRCKYN